MCTIEILLRFLKAQWCSNWMVHLQTVKWCHFFLHQCISYMKRHHICGYLQTKLEVQKTNLGVQRMSQNGFHTSNNKHDWTPVKYLNVLHQNRTQSSCDNFFLIYCKNITNFLFWVFWTCMATSSKRIIPTCRDFDVYLHVKNDHHS